MSAPDPTRRTVYSVEEISSLVQRTLEGSFPGVSVEGEVTGFKRAPSGHAYFGLGGRDANGGKLRLDCVIYRSARAAARVVLTDGQKVVATGRISSWGGTSHYQLIVEQCEDAGLGDLFRQLEALKRRLAAEGLFDPDRKRPLPRLPRCIGVVTSLQGAAVRDIVRTVLARFPTRIVIAPALVQGQGAADQIGAGIAALNRLPEVEVIIAGRGGGSHEDLWAFNEESVVRAIAASRVPVISAVGHEVDHLLSDDVADARASTPTAAGQLVVPVHGDLAAGLDGLGQRMASALERRIAEAARRVDEIDARLRSSGPRMLVNVRHSLALLGARLGARSPSRVLAEAGRRRQALRDRMRLSGSRLLEGHRRAIEALVLRLRPLSPYAPLDRGYALALGHDGRPVERFDQVSAGDAVDVLLREGAMACEVRETRLERSVTR